ncbi:MAG: rhodanese-like domain-containing protein [Candidatus Binatia bacterium]
MPEHEIDARALAARLARGEPTVLLDVREPWEHQLAALPGNVLVPLGEIAARSDDVCVPAGALVVTYCHHGVRSLQAALWLRAAGWADVVSLAGGIDAWSFTVDPLVPRY